ncbi:hypothetical protein PWT90_09778 [Aphanocladium album]|nr:hypothetical protein PWT90_09778 [Aphanocladium album]
MAAAAAPPPPPPPPPPDRGDNNEHRRPRRTTGGYLLQGNSEDEMYDTEEEINPWPCINCLRSARRTCRLKCEPSHTQRCTSCLRASKSCIYETELFCKYPILRRMIKRVQSLIDSGRAIKTPASGVPGQKGYKYPVASDEFRRVCDSFEDMLDRYLSAPPDATQQTSAAASMSVPVPPNPDATLGTRTNTEAAAEESAQRWLRIERASEDTHQTLLSILRRQETANNERLSREPARPSRRRRHEVRYDESPSPPPDRARRRLRRRRQEDDEGMPLPSDISGKE